MNLYTLSFINEFKRGISGSENWLFFYLGGTTRTTRSTTTDGSTDGSTTTEKPTIETTTGEPTDEFVWTDYWLDQFECTKSGTWQQTKRCDGASDCRTTHSCSVSVTQSASSFTLASNGIPDHNACHALNEQDYSYTITKTPKLKTGNQESFSLVIEIFFL